jgi:integrase
MASFLEYKTTIGGCKQESYMWALILLDKHCQTIGYEGQTISRELADGFLALREEKNLKTQGVSSIVRIFGRYLHDVLRMQDTYVIPYSKGRIPKTFVPYVFSRRQIRELLGAANRAVDAQSESRGRSPSFNSTIACMLTMLYCTGMRISEVRYLKMSNVDLKERVISIMHAKNDKHRRVTISESLAKACEAYLQKFREIRNPGQYFFDSLKPRNGGLMGGVTVYIHFRKLLDEIGIKHKGRGFGPRLHDIRVTFAVHSLMKLSKLPGDINEVVQILSAYMGHKSIKETQEYLWLTAESFQDSLDKASASTSFILETFQAKLKEMDNDE